MPRAGVTFGGDSSTWAARTVCGDPHQQQSCSGMAKHSQHGHSSGSGNDQGAPGNSITQIMAIVNHHKIQGWFELEGTLNLLCAMGRDTSTGPGCSGCQLL